MGKIPELLNTAPYVVSHNSDDVYRRLLAMVISGDVAPGSALPPERTLCALFGVTRGVVREALKRLAQSHVIESVQGSGHRVHDWRDTAGIDILPELLSASDEADPALVVAVMEMRSAFGPDAARLCALRNPSETAARLERSILDIRQASDDQGRIAGQRLFWRTVIAGSGNIAYRLAYNSLLRFTISAGPILWTGLASEIEFTDGYRSVAQAIARGDHVSAEHVTRALLDRGKAGVLAEIARRRGVDAATAVL